MKHVKDILLNKPIAMKKKKKRIKITQERDDNNNENKYL